MDKEIKEILRYLEECVANDNRFLIDNNNATKLSYYITNLQEENKKLKETNEEHRKINGDLRKENQKLVKVIDELEKWLIKQKEAAKSCMEWNNKKGFNDIDYMRDIKMFEFVLNKLTELKGDNNE